MAQNTTPVTLQVQDFEEREVLMVDYKFEQATDVEGQLAGIPRGGRIDIRVKALNDGNNQLLAWSLAGTDPRNVTITFKNTVDDSTMKNIEGTGCYCVGYKEDWQEGIGHTETITIVCQVLKNGPVEFVNPWR